MKTTVAIVGSHPKTRTEFDFTRTDCDIWVFNEALSNPVETWCPRADAVFQMHAPTIWRNPRNRNDPKHYEWLSTQTETPVYMQARYDDVPGSVAFPLDEVLHFNNLNFNKIRYITSSVAYAIALAIYFGYKRIEIYGVEMETDTEYRYQRDGVAFWTGVAVGKGIEVETHCSMFEAPLYGYEGDARIGYATIQERISGNAEKLPALQAQYNEKRLITAEKIRHFTQTGENGEEIVKAVQVQLGFGIQYGQMDGARQENERYKKKADTMNEKTGEFIFSRQEFETARQSLTQKQVEMMTRSNVLAGQTESLFREAEKCKNALKRKKRMDEFVRVLDDYIRATITTAMLVGGVGENNFYLSTLDGLIKAAGGAKSEAVLLEAYASRE